MVVRTEADPAGGHVWLEVSDNGPGIPADALPGVCEPFFTTKAAGEGTGLGLVLCDRICHDHGGRMAISNTGSGVRGLVALSSWTPVPEAHAPLTAAAAPSSRVLSVSARRISSSACSTSKGFGKYS